MDIKVIILDQLRENYKPLLLLFSGTALYYIVSKCFKSTCENCNKRSVPRELPTVEDIQKFIEELPLDISNIDTTQEGLRDLLGELSEFSEDEEWKELVASLQKFYQENNVI